MVTIVARFQNGRKAVAKDMKGTIEQFVHAFDPFQPDYYMVKQAVRNKQSVTMASDIIECYREDLGIR